MNMEDYDDIGCGPDKYYVFGEWDDVNRSLVCGANKENVSFEFDNVNDATEFIKHQIDSNVNISWCVCKSNPKYFANQYKEAYKEQLRVIFNKLSEDEIRYLFETHPVMKKVKEIIK